MHRPRFVGQHGANPIRQQIHAFLLRQEDLRIAVFEIPIHLRAQFRQTVEMVVMHMRHKNRADGIVVDPIAAQQRRNRRTGIDNISIPARLNKNRRAKPIRFRDPVAGTGEQQFHK